MTLQSSPSPFNFGRSRLQKLFQESPLPMWVLHGGSLRFLAVNQAALRLYGYSSAEFRTLDVSAIHQADQSSLPVSAFRRGSATDLSGAAEHRRKDGSVVEVELFAHRVEMGDFVAWLVVIHDVSHVRAAERLELRLLAAEKAARLKDLMINTLSHELRAPLTSVRAILTTIETYWDQLAPGEIKQMIQSADRSAQSLEEMMSDILTLSRAEAYGLSIDPVELDLAEVVGGLLDEERAVAASREYRFLASASGAARADPRCLDLMLRNVLENARKYSPRGTPIYVSLDGDGEEVAVSVRDFGAGVRPSELEMIFEPFYRSSSAEAWRPGGTGLGLAIARAMAEAHQGSIRAANAADGGLVVTIKLPRRGPAAQWPLQAASGR